MWWILEDELEITMEGLGPAGWWMRGGLTEWWNFRISRYVDNKRRSTLIEDDDSF
jgi:hypothetical protein